jgi:phytoene desaturase
MDAANAAFFSDPKMVQLFDRYATYNGSDPYQVPATLNIIPYVEHHFGGFAVDGGIYQVVLAFERLAAERGTVFRYETPVTGILHDSGRITGVSTTEGSEPFDVVVSNTDVRLTYEALLNDPDAPMAQRYRKLTPSSSGIAFYWGVDRSFPELTVNNILFSRDYPTEFRQIFYEQRVPEDPTVYINITSKVTASDAPPSGENWFVLVNTPYDGGQDWDQEVAVVREKIITTIEKRLRAPISPHISCEEVLTPRDISRKTNTHRGSLYGIASNSRFAAFLRHPNRSRRYRGLYFVGGSAHPGGGMPLVVLSGAITAELVGRHER